MTGQSTCEVDIWYTCLQSGADLRPRVAPQCYGVRAGGAAEMGSSAVTLASTALRRFPAGDGHTIMTIPGFMGADGSTASCAGSGTSAATAPFPGAWGATPLKCARAADEFLDTAGKTERRRPCRAGAAPAAQRSP